MIGDAAVDLIEQYIHLVLPIARKYEGRGVPLIDLIQEGNLGLIEAAEKYHPDKVPDFAPYAGWYIRKAINKRIGEQP